MASVVSNHLTAGIMKYFGDSFRFQQAANLFEKVSVREPEVASLLAKSYIGMSASSLSSEYGQMSNLSQTKKSRRSKSWQQHCGQIPNRTLSFMLSATFSVQRGSTNGLSNLLAKLSIVHLASS